MFELKPYRRAAVPLLAVQTADPAGVLRACLAQSKNGTTPPVLVWDCMHGIRPANDEAIDLAATLNGNADAAIATGNPAEALRALEQLGSNEDRPVVVMHAMVEVLSDAGCRQGLWNLRDTLTQSGSIVVLTVPYGWRNPWPNDIAVAEDPLPNREWLASRVARIAGDAGLDEPTPETCDRAADALIGLSGFAAEQAIALSLSKTGIDLDGLWQRKRQQVSQTAGLSIYAGKERFADLGGLDSSKAFFSGILSGKRRPGAIVFIDEIEKSLAGSAGDSSGVSQSLLGYLLSYMQDNQATGSIFIGPGGSGKSALAKAIGNEGQIPTVQLDLGGIKGSLVGESESRMREALAVVTAISGGRPMFIATCNKIAVLPPELRRRFTLGTFFFDLPSPEERACIWPIYTKRYGLDQQDLPKCDGWTGAEIAQCADLADRCGCSLIDAARSVVPISVSAREMIETLRSEAGGRYLSATTPGLYQSTTKTTATTKTRRIADAM